jgi:serine protease Do
MSPLILLVNAALLGLTIFGTSSAIAQWARLGATALNDKGFEHYADASTKQRTGSIVRMWMMDNFFNPQRLSDGRNYRSIAALEEFDCGEKRNRTLSYIYYADAMGSGAVIYSDNSPRGSWNYMVPGSVGATQLAFACSAASPSQRAPSARSASFELVNRSSQTILILKASPVDSTQWGEDKLSGVLPSGGREWILMPNDGRCSFDIQVIYSDLSKETKAGQNLCDLMELAFDGSRRVTAADTSGASAKPPAPPPARSVSYGTGFFVSSMGYALTNSHVVESCSSISVHLVGGKTSAEVLRRDSQNDLALIRVRNSGAARFVNFRSSPAVKIGESVVVAGFPLSNVLQNGLNVTVGNVSALAGLKGNASLLQITAPVQQGNSGGPLLDMSGNLVGVVVGKLNAARIAEVTGDIPQNINFAVKGTMARLFLEASGQQVAENPSKAELRTGDVSERAREYTFQIECQG